MKTPAPRSVRGPGSEQNQNQPYPTSTHHKPTSLSAAFGRGRNRSRRGLDPHLCSSGKRPVFTTLSKAVDGKPLAAILEVMERFAPKICRDVAADVLPVDKMKFAGESP
jgi:hypothetical protein